MCILSMGACVSRNCKRTSWKMGALGAEREPEATEPFSSAASDSPQRCKVREQTEEGFFHVFTLQYITLEALLALPSFHTSHFLCYLPTTALISPLTSLSNNSFLFVPYVLNISCKFTTFCLFGFVRQDLTM